MFNFDYMDKVDVTYHIYTDSAGRLAEWLRATCRKAPITEADKKGLRNSNNTFERALGYLYAAQTKNVKSTGRKYERYFHVDENLRVQVAAEPFEDRPCIPLSHIEDYQVFYSLSAPTFVSKTTGQCKPIFRRAEPLEDLPEAKESIFSISKAADLKKDVKYCYGVGPRAPRGVLLVANIPTFVGNIEKEYIQSAFVELVEYNPHDGRYDALVIDGIPFQLDEEPPMSLLEVLDEEQRLAELSKQLEESGNSLDILAAANSMKEPGLSKADNLLDAIKIAE